MFLHSEALRTSIDSSRSASQARLEARRKQRQSLRATTKAGTGTVGVGERMREMDADVLEEDAAAAVLAVRGGVVAKQKALQSLTADEVDGLIEAQEERLAAAEEAQIDADAEAAMASKLAEHASISLDGGACSPDFMRANLEAEVESLKLSLDTQKVHQREVLTRKREARRVARSQAKTAAAAVAAAASSAGGAGGGESKEGGGGTGGAGGAVARLENEALGRAVAEALDVEELVLTAERRTSTMNLKARLAKRRADACTMAANGGNPAALLKEAEGDVALAQADAAKSETTRSPSSSSSTRETHGAAVKALDEAYRKDVTQMQTDLEIRRKMKKEALQSKLADRRKARSAEGGGGKVSLRVYTRYYG